LLKSLKKLINGLDKENIKMAKYEISARVDGVMKTHIVDALDKDDAAQYGFCMWGVEDVWVDKVEEDK
jgi:RNA binding exosome subunit